MTIHLKIKICSDFLCFSSNSLFAIPLNDEFVFISDEKPPDKLGDCVRNLINGCSSNRAFDIKFPFSTQSNVEHSFSKLLDIHIQQARGKGFHDSVTSRHSHQPPSHFEVRILQRVLGKFL